MWGIMKEVLFLLLGIVNIILFYSFIGLALWDWDQNSSARGFMAMIIYNLTIAAIGLNLMSGEEQMMGAGAPQEPLLQHLALLQQLAALATGPAPAG